MRNFTDAEKILIRENAQAIEKWVKENICPHLNQRVHITYYDMENSDREYTLLVTPLNDPKNYYNPWDVRNGCDLYVAVSCGGIYTPLDAIGQRPAIISLMDKWPTIKEKLLKMATIPDKINKAIINFKI